MSEPTDQSEEMGESGKVAYAIIAVFVIGFIIVGVNKMEPSNEQKEGKAMVYNYVNLQTMANQKCPTAIKEATNEQVFFPSNTESDKETYITMFWDGENAAKGGFKKASCTINSILGGISELKVDDKVLISKKVDSNL